MQDRNKTKDQLIAELVEMRQRIAELEAGEARRTQAEQALRDSQARLAGIIGSAMDAIISIDADQRIVLFNAAAEQMFRCPAAEVLGQPIDRFISPHLREAHVQHIHHSGATHTTSRTMHELQPMAALRADGETFPIEATISQVEADGHKLYTVIIRDISERKQAEAERAAAEALRQSEQLKSQFLANISHDLRTPLHHVKGYASTLLGRGMRLDHQTIKEYLQIICDESDKLVHLIEDLLNTSQLESGTFMLDIDSVQIDELVRSAVQRWQGVEAYHFETVIPDIVPPIPADAHRIQRVLDNLLANVVRHTPLNTHTAVGLEIMREELVITVSDSGPGIDIKDTPFLFDRFYRAATSGSSRGGSGLGLFICKGIVEAHGGRIWVEVTPGSGTTFRFSLPRRHPVSMFRATPLWHGSVSDDSRECSLHKGAV